MLQLFIGQVMGTSAGSKVFVDHGWRAAAGLALGWQGFCLIVLCMRGPNARRYTWFGWEGGWKARKKVEGSTAEAGPGDLESGSQPKSDEKKSVERDGQDAGQNDSVEKRLEPTRATTENEKVDSKRTES